MLVGIPYFGEKNTDIYNDILNSKCSDTIDYESLYELIDKNIANRLIVIINNKWLTWLNDIRFNYRDKTAYIPYFSYDLFEHTVKGNSTDNEGHLIKFGNTVYIRHNYLLNKYEIDINSIQFDVYNVKENKRYALTVNSKKWTSEEKFNIDKVYGLYLDSCYKQDDFLVNKHSGGYHYILRNPYTFSNRELKYRDELGLRHYSIKHEPEVRYRDVRQYTIEQVNQLVGIRTNTELYEIRKLKFESYLYCLLRENLKSDDDAFNIQLEALGKTEQFIKYGKGIRLIFKSYWLNEYETLDRKSWSRV